MRKLLVVLPLLTLMGAQCGESGNCTVTKDPSTGVATITCPDGTSVDVSPGARGETGAAGKDGAKGETGTNCTVTRDAAAGTTIVTCADGTTATVLDGADGANGSDGSPGPAGDAGRDGTSCTVFRDADAGVTTLACADGTHATVLDGSDGSPGPAGDAGKDGVNCTVSKDSDAGVTTIACDDGTRATVLDGTTSLVALEEEPPSANCVQGGTRVLSGTDSDRDGSLDPAEVVQVRYLCGTGPGTGCTVLEGSYFVHNALDWQALSRAGCTGIAGSLLIEATGLVSLPDIPHLQSIGGLLSVNTPTIGGLSLSGLTSVGGDLNVAWNGSLAAVSLPRLASVGGEIWMRSNRSLSSLSLPELMTVGGRFELTDGQSAPGNPLLVTFTLPKLQSVNGHSPAGCGDVTPYHDDGRGLAVCVLRGTCASGFHDGGGGECVAVGTCTSGFHDDGTGGCVGRGCAPGYHDDGAGTCVQSGCASGFHDGGAGDCVADGTCGGGFKNDGTGTCVAWGAACATGFHDDGVGRCVSVGCAKGFAVDSSGACVLGCLAVAPDALDFGTVKVGCSSSPRTFTVYNTCSDPITLSSAALSAGSPEFVLVSSPANTTLQPASSGVTFQAKYSPQDFGLDHGAISLSVGENGRVLLYEVALSGTGDALGIQADTFVAAGAGKADVLLVIDDSGSMQDKQVALANNFSSFFQYANAAGVDYQLGVTTTDLDDQYCPGFGLPCTGPGPKGRLLEDVNNPKVLTRNLSNVSALFSQKVNVGTNGSPEEKGLAAAELALTPPLITSDNRDLLRPDASLGVVVVTDAVDQSAQSVAYYLNRLLNVKGFNHPNAFTFSVVGPFLAGGPQNGCSYDDPNAGPDTRYAYLSTQTAGAMGEICDYNWAATLQRVGKTAFGYRTSYYLAGTPDPSRTGSIKVMLDGVELPVGVGRWAYDPAANSVAFDPSNAPQPGEEIKVMYDTACF